MNLGEFVTLFCLKCQCCVPRIQVKPKILQTNATMTDTAVPDLKKLTRNSIETGMIMSSAHSNTSWSLWMGAEPVSKAAS